MADEQDKDKMEQLDAAAPVIPNPPVGDDWASAFASLEESAPAGDEGDSKATADDGTGAPADTGIAPPAPPAQGAAGTTGDSGVGAGDSGGSVPGPDGAGDEAPIDVEAVIKGYTSEAERRAIDETAKMFSERTDDQGRMLIRQSNGKLGATINDPDIYRVDESTGAPTFYNPDTGRPFTGDNPRAQAKQWVEEYNEELRDTFNRMAGERQEQLETEMAPVVELLRFAPTFKKLDPTRQKMLEAIIEDYEVYDDKGDHIGYSCDLNKALAQVNKQVSSIQAGRAATAPAPPAEPTGPALDMPNSGSGVSGQRPDFKNLSEAMEWEQDQQLAKHKK